MTTANKITIGRILLVPVFIVQVIYYADTGNEYFRAVAVLAFALAASADADVYKRQVLPGSIIHGPLRPREVERHLQGTGLRNGHIRRGH